MSLRQEVAVDADVPSILELRAAVADALTKRYGPGSWSRHSTEKGVRFEMHSPGFLVFRQRGKIVATLRLVTKKPWAIDLQYFKAVRKPLHLVAMAVMPTRQRRDLGRECMGAAVAFARQSAANAIRLDAYNAPAGAGEFYAKCGFQEVGRASYRGCPLRYFEMIL